MLIPSSFGKPQNAKGSKVECVKSGKCLDWLTAEMRPGTDTRIFSPALVPELCATNGHQLNEFNSLNSLRTRSIFRSEQISANGSGKVVIPPERVLVKSETNKGDLFLPRRRRWGHCGWVGCNRGWRSCLRSVLWLSATKQRQRKAKQPAEPQDCWYNWKIRYN